MRRLVNINKKEPVKSEAHKATPITQYCFSGAFAYDASPQRDVPRRLPRQAISQTSASQMQIRKTKGVHCVVELVSKQ